MRPLLWKKQRNRLTGVGFVDVGHETEKLADFRLDELADLGLIVGIDGVDLFSELVAPLCRIGGET